MNNIYLIIFSILLTVTSSNVEADTVDVWKVKLNDQIIINSNLMEIVYLDKPMNIVIGDYRSTDTLKLIYWTDYGGHKYSWSLLLMGKQNQPLGIYENKIDSTIECYPSPCDTFVFKQNFISFSTFEINQIFKVSKLDEIYIYFDYDIGNDSDPYKRKPICIIRKK